MIQAAHMIQALAALLTQAVINMNPIFQYLLLIMTYAIICFTSVTIWIPAILCGYLMTRSLWLHNKRKQLSSKQLEYMLSPYEMEARFWIWDFTKLQKKLIKYE